MEDKNSVKWLLLRKAIAYLGDWLFNIFGYHDWEYKIYDYYGNYKTKRVWRLKMFGKVYTRDYDDYFA